MHYFSDCECAGDMPTEQKFVRFSEETSSTYVLDLHQLRKTTHEFVHAQWILDIDMRKATMPNLRFMTAWTGWCQGSSCTGRSKHKYSGVDESWPISEYCPIRRELLQYIRATEMILNAIISQTSCEYKVINQRQNKLDPWRRMTQSSNGIMTPLKVSVVTISLSARQAVLWSHEIKDRGTKAFLAYKFWIVAPYRIWSSMLPRQPFPFHNLCTHWSRLHLGASLY